MDVMQLLYLLIGDSQCKKSARVINVNSPFNYIDVGMDIF